MNALDAALYSRMSASTALTTQLGGTNIYSLRVTQTPIPNAFVEFGVQGGGDENFNDTRMKNLLVRIKAVAKTKSTAGAADAIIDALFTNSNPLTISGWGNNFWLAREADIEFAEVDDASQTYFHVGGLYRIRFNEA